VVTYVERRQSATNIPFDKTLPPIASFSIYLYIIYIIINNNVGLAMYVVFSWLVEDWREASRCRIEDAAAWPAQLYCFFFLACHRAPTTTRCSCSQQDSFCLVEVSFGRLKAECFGCCCPTAHCI